MNICNEYQSWYYNKWINDEWDFIGRNEKRKYNNSINKFGQEMTKMVLAAVEKSKTDFRINVDSNNNFKNEIKALLEQLNGTDGTINDWSILLNDNGYSLTKYGYNNIERFGYNLQFLINACMFLDQEFPNNDISDSIIEKAKRDMHQTRASNR
jgi:hypothetical protein